MEHCLWAYCASASCPSLSGSLSLQLPSSAEEQEGPTLAVSELKRSAKSWQGLTDSQRSVRKCVRKQHPPNRMIQSPDTDTHNLLRPSDFHRTSKSPSRVSRAPNNQTCLYEHNRNVPTTPPLPKRPLILQVVGSGTLVFSKRASPNLK